MAEKLKAIPGHVVPSLRNTSIKEGIGSGINASFATVHQKLSISKPSLFISKNCVNTIREFETYRWKEEMKFIAEIRKVEAKKLMSADMQISITFITDDTRALDLGKIPPDELVKVEVKKEHD